LKTEAQLGVASPQGLEPPENPGRLTVKQAEFTDLFDAVFSRPSSNEKIFGG